MSGPGVRELGLKVAFCDERFPILLKCRFEPGVRVLDFFLSRVSLLDRSQERETKDSCIHGGIHVGDINEGSLSYFP